MELIIYLGLSAIVFTIAVNLMVTVTKGQTQAKAHQDLYSSARVMINEVSNTIREANGFDESSSDLEVTPGKLVLDYPDGEVVIDTSQKNQVVGGNSITIDKLRIKEGENEPLDLTPDNINVTEFTVADCTRFNEEECVEIQIELTAGESQLNTETTISLRQHNA